MRHRTLLTNTVVALLLGCGATPGARPDDMSAEAHREAADGHESEARAHEAEYDPREVRARTQRAVGGAAELYTWDEYNPTAWHLARSEHHERHAAAHRAAARELERFEGEECAPFEGAVRAACPLLGSIVATETVEGGVRMEVREGIEVAALLAHMRCHFAFGRTRGREGMPHCPLYFSDLEIAQVGDRTLEITTTQADEVDEIRRRAAAHVGE